MPSAKEAVHRNYCPVRRDVIGTLGAKEMKPYLHCQQGMGDPVHSQKGAARTARAPARRVRAQLSCPTTPIMSQGRVQMPRLGTHAGCLPRLWCPEP